MATWATPAASSAWASRRPAWSRSASPASSPSAPAATTTTRSPSIAAAGLAATRDARSTANTATIVTIAGGVAVVGGLTLYLLAPRASREAHALYVAPSIGAHGGTVVVGGAF